MIEAGDRVRVLSLRCEGVVVGRATFARLLVLLDDDDERHPVLVGQHEVVPAEPRCTP